MVKKINEHTKQNIKDNLKTNADWENYIKSIISQSKNATIRALMVVFYNQTSDERVTRSVIESNKKGFNAIDVVPLSKIAEKYFKENIINDTDLEFVRKRIKKYWRQIMVESKRNLKDIQKKEQVNHKTPVENELIARKQAHLALQQNALKEMNDDQIMKNQMQLDLFPEGEYHRDMIPRFPSRVDAHTEKRKRLKEANHNE